MQFACPVHCISNESSDPTNFTFFSNSSRFVLLEQLFMSFGLSRTNMVNHTSKHIIHILESLYLVSNLLHFHLLSSWDMFLECARIGSIQFKENSSMFCHFSHFALDTIK